MDEITWKTSISKGSNKQWFNTETQVILGNLKKATYPSDTQQPEHFVAAK